MPQYLAAIQRPENYELPSDGVGSQGRRCLQGAVEVREFFAMPKE
jgi:hypothetical protein